MEPCIQRKEDISGSGGDLWRTWEMELEDTRYLIQETRIGFQVLKYKPQGGMTGATPEEKQIVLDHFKRYLQES